jgi:hypothetical protein
MSNMKASLIMKIRSQNSDTQFSEYVVWEVPLAVDGSEHSYKYRFAFVSDGVCVVRYDNEIGKGDHRHFGNSEFDYVFKDIETLVADFRADIVRWKNENGNT